jgi:hypothetical protein
MNKFLVVLLAVCVVLGLNVALAVSQSPHAVIKEKYLQKKAQYQNLKANYTDAKNTYITAKQRYKNATIGLALFVNNTKNFLGKSIDAMLGILEKLKLQVNESDAQKIETVWIPYLQNKKLELEKATTKAEVIAITKDFHQKWASYKRELKRMIGQEFNEKIVGIIKNANGLAKKINSTIQKLKEQGIDTSAIETKLSNFQTKITLAAEKYEQAKQKYKEAQNATEIDQILQEAHQFLKEAHQYLKEAHKELRDLIKSLKQKAAEPVTGLNETEIENETVE